MHYTQTRFHKIISRTLKAIFLAFIPLCILCLHASYVVTSTAQGKTFSDIALLPASDYGLILGMPKINAEHEINLDYQSRINAAVQLFRAQKVHYLIASGSPVYDEVESMHQDLLASGIPEESVLLDPQGLRTLASIRNAKEKFHLNSFIIISQEYHNQRAIYLAKILGIETIAFNAKKNKQPYLIPLREVFARVKAVWENKAS